MLYGTAVSLVDAADGPEVVLPCPPRLRDDDIARMEVGVEDALAEHLTHDYEEQVLSDFPAGDLRQSVDDHGGVGQRSALDEGHDEDVVAGQLPVHVRKVDERVRMRCGPAGPSGEAERVDVPEFAA